MYKFLYFIALSFIINCASPSKQLEAIDDADSKELTFIIELSTKGNSKEKVEEFTQYLAEFIKEREPSSIYGYFISEDGSKVTLIERYNNSEDGIQHGIDFINGPNFDKFFELFEINTSQGLLI